MRQGRSHPNGPTLRSALVAKECRERLPTFFRLLPKSSKLADGRLSFSIMLPIGNQFTAIFLKECRSWSRQGLVILGEPIFYTESWEPYRMKRHAAYSRSWFRRSQKIPRCRT